jgi:nitrate/nitrite transporter NarK
LGAAPSADRGCRGGGGRQCAVCLLPDLWWANTGRLLVGASVAVAFVSMLKLATHWFAPRQFALASGMALFCGVVGGVMAGVPLRMLIEAWGWRPVMATSALVTGLLAVAIWLRVRDDPRDLGYLSHAPATLTGSGPCGDPQGMIEVLSYRNIWILLITPIGIAGRRADLCRPLGRALSAPGAWPRNPAAAAITSLLLIAWAVGGPLLGALSERIGQRRPLYVGPPPRRSPAGR